MQRNTYSNSKMSFQDRRQHHSNQKRHFRNNRRYNNTNQNDEFNAYINNPVTKQELVDYIYDSTEIGKYKYRIMKFESDLPLINNMKYYVSANYNGINCLMVFKKIQDKYYSFMVDRRTLSYNQSTLDINKIKIIPFSIQLNRSVYNGTILDGVLLYNHKGKRNFVINDVFQMRGQNLTGDMINHKMINITEFVNSSIRKDDRLNNINVIFNILYELRDIKKLINVYIPNAKYNVSIKGIAFYPETSGTKLIYLYSNCSQEEVSTDSDPKPQMPKEKKPIRQVNIEEEEDDITAIFRMKRTETVDVYQLYLSNKIEKNGKKFVKFKKYGIAYLPTLECSYFCKDLFENTDSDAIMIKCKYLADRQKWVPIKHSPESKIPDELDTIKEKL